MKKAIMFLILAAMLTGCTNSENQAAAAVTPEIIQTVTTVTAASVPETETTTTSSDMTETTETSDTTAESTSMTDTEMTVTSVTEASVSESITSTRKPETQSIGRDTDTTTTTTKAVTSVSAESRKSTTTVKSGVPKSTTSVSVTSSKPKTTTTTSAAATTTTTTTTTTKTIAAPNGINWSDSMKVWRKLCEGKKLTGSEQDLIRSEILNYAVSSFNGKKDIHVSFGIDSYDISYEKPLNLTADRKMTDLSNAHYDSYANANCKAMIGYASREQEIYDIVCDARQSCMRIIDRGLFNRWEIFSMSGSLKYASDISFNVGFDEDMAIWFLTQD